MYQFEYADILNDDGSNARQQEGEALAKSIEMLQTAQEKGPNSREAIEALYFTRRLWAIFMEDLASADNGLPKTLRADLISIGMWVMKEAERLRRGETEDFSGLIEISETIRAGLK